MSSLRSCSLYTRKLMKIKALRSRNLLYAWKEGKKKRSWKSLKLDRVKTLIVVFLYKPKKKRRKKMTSSISVRCFTLSQSSWSTSSCPKSPDSTVWYTIHTLWSMMMKKERKWFLPMKRMQLFSRKYIISIRVAWIRRECFCWILQVKLSFGLERKFKIKIDCWFYN